jgi:hypothetical protein
VKRIAAEGHEGFARLRTRGRVPATPTQFREDVRRSKLQLENLAGAAVKATARRTFRS